MIDVHSYTSPNGRPHQYHDPRPLSVARAGRCIQQRRGYYVVIAHASCIAMECVHGIERRNDAFFGSPEAINVLARVIAFRWQFSIMERGKPDRLPDAMERAIAAQTYHIPELAAVRPDLVGWVRHHRPSLYHDDLRAMLALAIDPELRIEDLHAVLSLPRSDEQHPIESNDDYVVAALELYTAPSNIGEHRATLREIVYGTNLSQ
ncbi:hypothetical protein HYV74_02340 [Candidatus Uhrbacteria bacterium]|nr:hypothetical protein [Candidatus Uhrbacteria bacterium]